MSIVTGSRITHWLGGELRTADEVRDAVYLDAPPKLTRFWLLLVLSAVIASAGVIGNSTATVIGAMIIAPLATPIQGIAVALAGGELAALLKSASTLVTAAVAVAALGAVASWVLPEVVPAASNGQITSRVSPTVIDLVAAAATGLAGSLAIARRDIGDILPGVAIAISLVPPLAVVGITAADGAWHDTVGALLLFTTNVLAIIVAGTLLYSLLELLPQAADAPSMRRRPVYLVVAVAGAVVVLALSVVTYRTVQLHQREASARAIATSWAERGGEALIGVRYEGEALVVHVEGDAPGAGDAQLLSALTGAVPAGTPVELNRVPGERRALGTVP
ncbi:DUF389 domain-containing protein [Solirubrobacter phytolaccae]|uniref:DUF389 domain-containing protein n=1 Tax=Solirubrobacter phytolaccae TaxID=1404360 RepID=A0A9X3SBA8_9ACTN|nr:DUF389 domain-containing protein [Solirubrobacter phytolaccae]MDA0183426.1 DUF389 domain-containing protein [Solirubrobacter phytolaccae]